MPNVRTMDAIGDGLHDDREAIQAAINLATPGDPVWIPNGTYRVGQAGAAYACLMARPGISIVGESRDGAIIRAANGLGQSCSVLHVIDSPDVTIRNLTIDGNRSGQDVNQWRHCVFGKLSPRLYLAGVTLTAAGGDGIELYDGSNCPIVTDVLCTGNTRNGLTLGGATTGGSFVDSRFVGNGAQQFDSEGGPVHDVTIRNCLFDGLGVSQDHVLTMTGQAADNRSHGWTVSDNIVNGSTAMVWIDDVIYARNTGINSTGKPSVFVYRRCEKIRIHDNVLHTTAAATFDTGGMIHVTATGSVGQSSTDVRIEGNTLTTTADAYGICAIGARDILIADNSVRGGGAGSGVFVRAILPSVPTEYATIQRNLIAGFADYGVYLAGNGPPSDFAKILNVDITKNTFDRPLMLGDDNNTVRVCTVADNAYAGIGQLVARAPGGTAHTWATGTRWTLL